MLHQPAPAGNGGGQRGGAQQVVTTAVAVRPRRRGSRIRALRLLTKPGQRIIFTQQGNHRLSAAVAGDKGVGDPAGLTADLKTFCFKGERQPFG